MKLKMSQDGIKNYEQLPNKMLKFQLFDGALKFYYHRVWTMDSLTDPTLAETKLE